MVSWTVRSTNGKNLDSFLRSLKFDEPLRKSEPRLKEDLDRNFQQQGAILQGGGFTRPGGAFANLGKATTVGRAWAPLAESTRKQRAAQGYGAARPILQRSGKLRRGFRTKVKNEELSATNNVSYSPYHQYGTAKMPQRLILGFSKKFVEATIMEIINYIRMEIRKAS